MRNIAWTRLVALALALFFVVGGVGNIAAPGDVAADYARWGYPAGFHYVTGALELLAAVLLVRQPTRRWGILLGLVLMGAAATTVLIHGEIAHGAAPLAVFAMLLALGLALGRKH